MRLIDRHVARARGARAGRSIPQVKLAINISGLHRGRPRLAAGADRAWSRNRRDVAQRLIVEITETVALQDIEETARFVGAMRELGCRVALDDFGAGYTSFRNLQGACRRLRQDRRLVRPRPRRQCRQPAVHPHAARACRRLRPRDRRRVRRNRRRCRASARAGRALPARLSFRATDRRAALARSFGDAAPGTRARRVAADAAFPDRVAPALFLRQVVEAALHRGELVAQLVDARRGLGFLAGAGLGGVRASHPRHPAHRPRTARTSSIAFWNRARFCLPISSSCWPKGSWPNGRIRRTRRHVLAHLLLVLRERTHRVLEVARHQSLQAVAVEADELPQEADRQQVLPPLPSSSTMIWVSTERVMSSPVLASWTTNSRALLDHLAQMVERHVAAGGGVVEPPVGVFLDPDLGPIALFALAWRVGRLGRMGRWREAWLMLHRRAANWQGPQRPDIVVSPWPTRPISIRSRRRYVDLWQDQVAAMAADPELSDLMGRLSRPWPWAPAGVMAMWTAAAGKQESDGDRAAMPAADPSAAAGAAAAAAASGDSRRRRG